jgi:hypothetical protein
MSDKGRIAGFLTRWKQSANKKLYRGRFTCAGVQWTGEGADSFATFTITASELADAADSGLIWTDQDVQRGIVPGVSPSPAREICLSVGYPQAGKYVFDANNADEITEKLLTGEKLFLSPLIWNLRPGTFEAFSDEAESSIYIYQGRVYLPDSHHRHQAIVKAVRLWRDAPRDYPKFNGDRQFKVELYFLTREDEGNYFFDKNQRPKPTSKSKAYDLTTVDDLSLLAKRVVEFSSSLRENVNRVTDRLTAKNPQVVTLSTLREMMRAVAPGDAIDPSQLDGIALVAAKFYDRLAAVRMELGALEVAERREVRDKKLVDSAVMMHGYAALMRDYNEDLARLGTSKANHEWDAKLSYLRPDAVYRMEKWRGDLFDKTCPLWQRIGVVKPGKSEKKRTVINTGGARSECARVLRTLLAMAERPTDLSFLASK